MMERLTEKSKGTKGVYQIINPTFERCRAAIDKLAEYEDLEEQGLLARLPCKVGDTVWPVFYDFPIFPVEVKEIKNDGVGRWKLEGAGTTIFFSEFGETVFLTREEAEAALEKMGGDEE